MYCLNGFYMTKSEWIINYYYEIDENDAIFLVSFSQDELSLVKRYKETQTKYYQQELDRELPF